MFAITLITQSYIYLSKKWSWEQTSSEPKFEVTFLETWQVRDCCFPVFPDGPKKSWIGISLCPFPTCTYRIPEVNRRITIRTSFSVRRWTFDRQTCPHPSLESPTPAFATDNTNKPVKMGNLVSFVSGVVAPLFLIVAPITSYADQIWSIHKSKSSAGFSLDIPLIMLVASLLRYVADDWRTWTHTNKNAQNILFSRGTIRYRSTYPILHHDRHADGTSQGCAGSQTGPSLKRGRCSNTICRTQGRGISKAI